MGDFNSVLIKNIKLFKNDQMDEEYSDEKYDFLLYVFEQIEGVSQDEITICDEEFPYLNANVDGFHFNEDSNVYNLILSLYSNDNDDSSTINEKNYLYEVEKIKNLITMIQNKKYESFPDSSLTYEICDTIYKQIKDCEIIVTIFSNFNIAKEYKKDDIVQIGSINVSFNTYDLIDLKEKFIQLTKDVEILNVNEKFGCSIPAIKISSTIDFDVYMCSFKGSWLAQLYKEDGQRLLEPNVRSYLKRTQRTNAGILETVKSYPDQFVSYNNGLSSIASNAEVTFVSTNKNFVQINKIHNFQIVNGGQTTATLSECAKDKLTKELEEVVVPVKLTVIKNIVNAPMLISNISVFSNTQTAIKKSDPPSNLKYYIDLKNVSSNVTLVNQKGKNYICYFERTSGEYDTELKRNNSTVSFQTKNPKDKKFNKIQLAIAINCWQQLPYLVNNGREKNFIAFNSIVKNQMLDINEEYFKKAYATVILFRQIDKLCKKQKLSYKSNVVTYTLSYLSYLSNKSIDLIKIFNNQTIDDNLIEIINDILPKVHTKLCNAPSNCPEVRMWARKEKLWENLKLMGLKYNFLSLAEITDFFPTNEPQVFIDNENNFYNEVLWRKLLIWNDKKKVLNNSQSNMVKGVIKNVSMNTSMTRKQINYAKDIFMAAVKGGFQYK